MGRSPMSLNTSNYHFVVWYKKDPTSVDEIPSKKYYKTTAEKISESADQLSIISTQK